MTKLANLYLNVYLYIYVKGANRSPVQAPLAKACRSRFDKRLLDQRGGWQGSKNNLHFLLKLSFYNRIFSVFSLHSRVQFMYFLFIDGWSGKPIWLQKLANGCKTPEGEDSKTVSRALEKPPGSSGQKDRVEHRGGPHHLQSPVHSREPVGRDCQTAPWKVGWLSVMDWFGSNFPQWMINLHHLVIVKLSLTVTVELIGLLVTISKSSQHSTWCYYLMYYLMCFMWPTWNVLSGNTWPLHQPGLGPSCSSGALLLMWLPLHPTSTGSACVRLLHSSVLAAIAVYFRLLHS